MLNVTVSHLSNAIARLPELDAQELHEFAGEALFNLLDHALYGDDDCSMEEIMADAQRFSRFNFLTNGGESFDHSKSFIVGNGQWLRLLFKDLKTERIHAVAVEYATFVAVIQAFLSWFSTEQASPLLAPSERT